MISIVGYEERYAAEFKELNLAWLEQYHLLESHDLMILDHPRANVLDRGGYIWLALDAEDGQISSRSQDSSASKASGQAARVVGTAALIHEHDDCYELAKMTVAPAWRGRGISKLLIEQCLRKAMEIGASKLILFSNSQLQTAIRLYSQYGFQHVPVKDAPFVTADVKMELIFS